MVGAEAEDGALATSQGEVRPTGEALEAAEGASGGIEDPGMAGCDSLVSLTSSTQLDPVHTQRRGTVCRCEERVRHTVAVCIRGVCCSA